MKIAPMRLSVIPAVFASCFAISSALADSAGPWSASFQASDDYVQYGLSQTRGESSLQGGVTYSSAKGFYLGVWGAGVDLYPPQFATQAPSLEVDLTAGYGARLNERWTAAFEARHYLYPDNDLPYDYDYTEFSIATHFRDVLRLAVSVTPDLTLPGWRGTPHHGTAIAYEASARQPLWRWFSLTGGGGYRDLEDLVENSYVFWHAGVSADFGSVAVQFARYGTDATARRIFGRRVAEDRSAVSVSVSF